jgi:hypothetical protein
LRSRICGLLHCVLFALAAAGCFQELDSRAARATNETIPIREDFHTVDLETPAIGITSGDNGMTTDNPCEATSFQVGEILKRNCAGCHGGGPGQNLGQPAFDYVLNVSKMLTAVSTSVKDPETKEPVHFLVPGEPEKSRVYVRVFQREMPPRDVVGLPENNNRPTVSDISVIHHWISNCLAKEKE